MSKIIGIDLGTTNSCVSFIEGGKPVVIPNLEGAHTTPSIVAFMPNGDRLVGQAAKRQSVTNAENTIYSAKRLIGRTYNEEEVRFEQSLVPFKLISTERGDVGIQVRDKTYLPTDISALVLAKMKEIAEVFFNEPISHAVITVPAYFNDGQRQATRQAGQLAGLEILRIVNEPTAAALAYGLEKQGNRKVAVYDLGGGTFDISILELSAGVLNVLATNGDTHLGGEDFDHCLLNWLCAEFSQEHNIDLLKDKIALQRLKEATEKAKHELSSSTETDINLPFIAAGQSGPVHLNIRLTRQKLEELTHELLQRTLAPVQQALNDANLTVQQIDDVLLVGGMTRMPKVQQLVADFFKRQPNRQINPDEVVAMGAAIQGAILSGDINDMLLLDVTPLSLGIETAGGVFTPMIARNSTVPCKASQIFSTNTDNQSLVIVNVLQGERLMAADNQLLTQLELSNLLPAPRGVPQIEITFELDVNGIFQATAKDLNTGNSQHVHLTQQGGLKEHEIAERLQQAASQEALDASKKLLADLSNQAEGLIYTTERSLTTLANKIGATDLDSLKSYISKLQEALEKSDLELLKNAYQELEACAHKITKMLSHP